jgi:hypothetical protein
MAQPLGRRQKVLLVLLVFVLLYFLLFSPETTISSETNTDKPEITTEQLIALRHQLAVQKKKVRLWFFALLSG